MCRTFGDGHLLNMKYFQTQQLTTMFCASINSKKKYKCYAVNVRFIYLKVNTLSLLMLGHLLMKNLGIFKDAFDT